MPEVTEGGGPECRYAEDRAQRSGIEARASREVRAIGDQRKHQQPAYECHGRYAEQHRLPGEELADAFEKVRERRPEHERADQKAERAAEVALIPARRDLHSHRIDAREKESGKEARGKQCREVLADEKRRGISRRAGRRAKEEQQARRVGIGQREKSKNQRTGDEAELDRRGDVAECLDRQSPLPLQVAEHRVAGEPERGAGELRRDDRRQDAPRTGQLRTSPWPSTTNFWVVRPSRPTGPRACSLSVEMPISAPRPYS